MAVPAGNHTDWIWPFSRIPRKWTAFESDIPPVRILGTELDPNLDIPEKGEWIVAGLGDLRIPVYFAITTRSGWHFRIGLFRYDFVDHYYQVGTFKIGKYE